MIRKLFIGSVVAGVAVAALLMTGGSAEKTEAARVEVRCSEGQVVSSLQYPFSWSQYRNQWQVNSAADRDICESGIDIPYLSSSYTVACEDGGTEDQEVVLVYRTSPFRPATLASNQVAITSLAQLAGCQPEDN